MIDVQAWSIAVAQPEHRREGMLHGNDADLRDAWKAVFENARAVEHSANVVSVHLTQPASRTRIVPDRVAPGSTSFEADQLVAARGPHTYLPASGEAPPNERSNADSKSSHVQPRMCEPFGMPAQASRIRNARPMPRVTETAPLVSSALASAATDSALVTLQGDAVSIVLRDAGLTEPEALRCAFAAAQHLTGRRSSLRLLMLNGRTLYCPHAPPAASLPPHAFLAFAC